MEQREAQKSEYDNIRENQNNSSTLQRSEDTSKLKPEDPFYATGNALIATVATQDKTVISPDRDLSPEKFVPVVKQRSSTMKYKKGDMNPYGEQDANRLQHPYQNNADGTILQGSSVFMLSESKQSPRS